MAGRDGTLRRLLPLLVVASLLVYSSLCSGEYRICNIPCCSLRPSCADALRVACECPDPISISIREGDIPASVESLYISGPAQLTFHKHAIYGLALLKTVHVDLRHNGELNVDEDGLALQSNNNLLSLIIENAKAVALATSAFAGFWTPAAVIEVQNVQRLHIEQHGFSFRSTRPGPSLSMDYVRDLAMAPNALNATISSLAMSNVNMPTCWNENFGGDIFRMRMNHVQINQVNERCIKASNMDTLSISSCDIETVKLQGFSGNIRDMEIKNTNVTKIEPYGFVLQVATLRITDCLFGALMANGLNVTAKDSIDLKRVNITTLWGQALAGLRVPSYQTGLQRTMHIHDVNITYAEQGSLAFSKRANLRFTGRLNVGVPDPPICPTKKWILWLVGKSEDDQLTDADNKLLGKLQSRRICPDTDTSALQRGATSQERTETGKLGSRLGDEGMCTPRTTNKASVPCEAEANKIQTLLGDDAPFRNPPETTPRTELPQKAAASDVPHEMGSSSTPEDDTSTRPEATPNEDVHVTPLREPEMAGTYSSVVIGVVIGVVVAVAVASALWIYSRCKKSKVSSEGQTDSLPAESEQLQAEPASGERDGEQTNQTIASHADIAGQSSDC